MKKALLIISCSDRKKAVKVSKAWDCYDGPSFRVLKKIQREQGLPRDLDIRIISAKYGLISPDRPIEYYNMKITKTRAQELHEEIIGNLTNLTARNNYYNVLINLGKNYLLAISGIEKLLPKNSRLVYAQGGIGKKISIMRKWVLSLICNKIDEL